MLPPGLVHIVGLKDSEEEKLEELLSFGKFNFPKYPLSPRRGTEIQSCLRSFPASKETSTNGAQHIPSITEEWPTGSGLSPACGLDIGEKFTSGIVLMSKPMPLSLTYLLV